MIASSHTLIVRTGWFDIHIDCEKIPSWITPLQNRYKDFLTSTSISAEQLQIALLPGQTLSEMMRNKPPTFFPDRVIFSPPGWEGMYDYGEKTGWVRPASSFIFEEIDYFLRVVCAIQAFKSGGLLLHAAGILRRQQAYIFLGHSGTGKTTIAQLSGKNNILNDDLVLLYPDSSGWTVYGTPFFNPTQIAPRGNLNGVLVMMLHLIQDQTVYVEETSASQSLAEIIANVPVISVDTFQTIELVSRCQTLLETVPTFHLHFRKDDSFWKVIDERANSGDLQRRVPK